MGLLSTIVGIPTIGRMFLDIMKNRAFKPFKNLEKVHEKQMQMLERKFRRMKATEIGRKLSIHKSSRLQNLPVTDYSFYEPFFQKPSPSAFMYDLEDYIKMRTSGTAGKEKWFMIPRKELKKSVFETGIQMILAIFHDGERITLEYGDNIYSNTAPRPFITGYLYSQAQDISGMINIVPNVNLSYHDKIRYFLLHHEKIDAAVMLASTLISQFIPFIKGPIKLKGVLFPDSTTAEVYRNEIAEFVGTIPKSSYQSTETLICTVPSVDHSLGFVFDWRRGIFEFLPIRGEKFKEEPIEMDQVKVGETYRLLFTSFMGELTKYDTNDCVTCVAKEDAILGIDYPIFKFRSRLEKTISLQNFTRISENELLTALRETGVSFMDFTARVKLKKGLEYLVMYLEQTGKMTDEEIRKSIHKQFYKTDQDYRDLVDFFDYVPIRIRLVPQGTFAKYLEGKIAAAPKVDRINMSNQEFKKILEIIKRQSM